jgi:hypothetical protein
MSFVATPMLVASLVVASGGVGFAAQKHFDSADAAVSAVVEAARNGDRAALESIFGPEAERVLLSGDPVADREARECFVARAAERTHLQRVGDDFAILSVGNDDWPFAIPLVKEKSGWIFDTVAGERELNNRRIGRNELYTMQVMQEYVAAQRDYARRKRAMDGVAEYAQKLRSSPGQRDGLYWDVQPGDNPSPMGPLFASAVSEGYRPGEHETPQPFHGYLYKPLTNAGPHAPGGARSYVRGGRLTDGFALLAYPVRYGTSGIMTFIVNNQGVIFQKDLGPQTAEIAARIDAYDPDDSWYPPDEN